MRFQLRECFPRFLAKYARILSLEGAGWVQPMFDEVEYIEGRRERVLWIAGICVAIARLSVRKLITDNGYRPAELTATGMYLFGFSIFVLAHLVAELSHGLQEAWIQAYMPIVLYLGLSAVPIFIAIRLWARDDFARMFATGFSLFDLLEVVHYAQKFGSTDFRLFKFICDLTIIALMFTPRVKDACLRRVDPREQTP